MTTAIHTVYEPIDALKPHPRNPKDHDLGAIIVSIQRFGYVTPIIVDERSSLVVSGHGRILALQAMRADGQAPPSNIEVNKAGEWCAPVLRGVRFNSDAELDAFLIADNQLTVRGGWNEPSLVKMLQSLHDHDPLLMTVTGFDGDDLQTLLEDLTTTQLPPEIEKGKKPNPRKLGIDAILTCGTMGQGALHDPTSTHGVCCLAVRSGWKYGVQSANGVCATALHMEAHLPAFIDNKYTDYDHAYHTAAVERWKPKYATTRDAMTRSQCKEAGIPYYSLEQILEWAAEIAQHTENVIVIPKYDCLDQIPEQYVLGFSVPTSHGGTPLPVSAFKGRRVHLLGGSWAAQLGFMAALGDDVVSFDNNYIMKSAKYGQFTYPDGRLGLLQEDLGINPNNPFHTCMAISTGNIGVMLNELYPNQAQFVTELEAFTDASDRAGEHEESP